MKWHCRDPNKEVLVTKACQPSHRISMSSYKDNLSIS